MVQIAQFQVARIFGTKQPTSYPARLDLLAADIRDRRLRYQSEAKESSTKGLLRLLERPLTRIEEVVSSSGHIRLHHGGILDLTVDALVNPTSTQLRHEGGLSAAIAARGGPGVIQDSKRIGWCDLGSAVATPARDLPAKYLIHVPTIDYVTWKMARLQDLGNGTRTALELARELEVRSVGLPLLGSGIAGLPTRSIALIILATLKAFSDLEVTVCADWPEDFAVMTSVMGN